MLTFALPLVSPRSLMVAPVALIWVAGALAGECIARRWYTLLPYVGLLVAFGLAYAATQRAAGVGAAVGPARETMLAAALLVTLLLMRVAQAWVRQDETAESTQPDGVLPLRGLVAGTVTPSSSPARRRSSCSRARSRSGRRRRSACRSVDQSKPLDAAVVHRRAAPAREQGAGTAGVHGHHRQAPRRATSPSPTSTSTTVRAGRSTARSARPAACCPADTDPALQRHARASPSSTGSTAGPLTDAPWMPFLYRAQNGHRASVNIDPASGMIVPAGTLSRRRPTPCGRASRATPSTASRRRYCDAGHGTSTIDTELPGRLRTTLDQLVKTFAPRPTLRRRRRCRSCRRCRRICARTTRSPARRRGRHRDGVADAHAEHTDADSRARSRARSRTTRPARSRDASRSSQPAGQPSRRTQRQHTADTAGDAHPDIQPGAQRRRPARPAPAGGYGRRRPASPTSSPRSSDRAARHA